MSKANLEVEQKLNEMLRVTGFRQLEDLVADGEGEGVVNVRIQARLFTLEVGRPGQVDVEHSDALDAEE